MYAINEQKIALTLQERIAEIAALNEVSDEVHHYSDGSELIPADVQAKMRRNGGQLLDVPLKAGYTVDGEGLTNAYTIEPEMQRAGYPTPERQRRYAIQGTVAALLVTLTVFTAFIVTQGISLTPSLSSDQQVGFFSKVAKLTGGASALKKPSRQLETDGINVVESVFVETVVIEIAGVATCLRGMATMQYRWRIDERKIGL